MKTIYCLAIILFAFFFTSCKERKHIGIEYDIIIIPINVKSSIGIDISNRTKHNIKEIPLELTDYSLLSHIEQIEFKGDRIFIYDRNRLIVFDKEGRFLNKIGRRGVGPGEYTNIASFFLKGGYVYIYDDNLQRIFVYEENGAFLRAKVVKESVSAIHPTNDGFIGRRKYQGSAIRTPTLVILDEDLSLVGNISNRFLTSGISTFDWSYSFNNSIVYWEFLNDTIFSLCVLSFQLIPKFYVDFQEFRVPDAARRNRDISETIQYIYSRNLTVATGIRYVQKDATYLRFIFAFENINYVKYNMQTREISLNYFYDSQGILTIQYVMRYNEGKIVLVVYDVEDYDNNPVLLLIDDI